MLLMKDGDVKLGETWRRYAENIKTRRGFKKVIVGIGVIIMVIITFFIIKNFGQTRDDKFMKKMFDYINEEMDRILQLETREAQNEAFASLKPEHPLIPIRMTLTTAVFKYTSIKPPVVLKRVIYNPANKLNEDYMSEGLKGPRIVKTFTTRRTTRMVNGKEQKLIWIFSEFLDIKLNQKSIKGNERKIREIMRDALISLNYMHSKNIAHLDLKIGNIMGMTTPEGIVYKLIDFGYAQLMPSSGSVVIPNKNYGTYPYKPPEIVHKNTHGLKSDIWSLGAIAWFLALQGTPFYIDNYKKDITAYKKFISSRKIDHTNHRFKFPENISNELRDFVKTCMQLDPDMRPTAKDLMNHPFIQGKNTVGYRSTSSDRMPSEEDSGFNSTESAM